MNEQQRSTANKALPQLQCLSSFFQNGLNRVRMVIGSEAFSFVVNGHRFESTISESIFLSPAVEELFLNDFGAREFAISNSSVDSNDLPILLNFIYLSISISAPSSNTLLSQKSLLTICRYLKNQQLELLALSSSDIFVKLHNLILSLLLALISNAVHLNSIHIQQQLF
jgi:hypothetical protein